MNALLVDIGNSRIKGRVIDRDSRTIIDLDAIPRDRFDRCADAWLLAHVDVDVGVAFVSNVAGDAGAAVVRDLRRRLPAMRVESVESTSSAAGVINGYREPARLGADRWMSLIGARALLPDRSLLVCGFGTATTLDLLAHEVGCDKATFVGGLIVPGFAAMRGALVERAAHLDVKGGNAVDFADNTKDAIASGVLWAQLGALNEAWRHARGRVAGRLECIVAGGAGRVVVEAIDESAVPGMAVHLVPDLVLRGLAVVAVARMHEDEHRKDAPTPAAAA